MTKLLCPKCQKEIVVEETTIKGQFRYARHWRTKPHDEEFEENIHLRNIVDELCPYSGNFVLYRV